MKSLTTRLLIAFFALLPILAMAQPKAPYTWKATIFPADARAGESAQIRFTVVVEEPWHIYQIGQTGGPMATAFEILKPGQVTANGKAIQPTPTMKQDPNFNIEVGLFEGTTIFALPVQIKKGAKGELKFDVQVTSQACNDTTCDIPRRNMVPVVIKVAKGAARADRLKPLTKVPDQPKKDPAEVVPMGTAPPPAAGVTDDFQRRVKDAEGRGPLAFMLFAFTMGLLALLTPCVFPMIPITVSFFSKHKSESNKPNYSGAFAYCLGIVGTFTALGILITAIFGASGISQLATNPFVNIGLAALFLVLAANLFGLFEIRLPSGLVNKVSSKSKTSTLVGAILMGLTFSLTSFTCTVPFVGTILVGAATGNYFYPVLGMLAFSTAFALPFFLLALFPQFLARLPKSGSWLSTTKAFMGFIEIAAAIKFISNVDLVYGWGLLTRPIFLAIWATIAVLAALYLLGWIRLGHESGEQKIGWPRRGFAALTIIGGYFCLLGIGGRPLGEFSAFLPPQPYPFKGERTEAPVAGEIAWISSYDDALTLAKKENRKVFVNFTGVTCTNCRWMEDNMFTQADIRKAMDGYVLSHLYTDRFTPEDENNRKIQVKLTNQVTLPVYVIVSPDGSVERISAFTRDKAEFLKFLTQS